MTTTIRLGVYDWNNFCPNQGFYPEDLPKDWRLAYFSNEFDAACIRLSGSKQDHEYMQQLLEEDYPEDFLLSFSVDQASDLEFINTVKVPCEYSNLRVIMQQQLDELSDQVKALGFEVTYIESMWRPDQAGLPCSEALISAQPNLRAYRDCIERWVNCQNGANTDLTLWVQASELSYKDLNDVKTLIELMGF